VILKIQQEEKHRKQLEVEKRQALERKQKSEQMQSLQGKSLDEILELTMDKRKIRRWAVGSILLLFVSLALTVTSIV